MNKVKVTNSSLQKNDIKISGYKHAAVTLIAASAYISKKVRIRNIPLIEDTYILSEILETLGAKTKFDNNTLVIDSSKLSGTIIPESLSEKIHGSLYLIPTILGRTGKVKIGRSGGCQIGDESVKGARPVHHMVDVLEKFGGRFKWENNVLTGECDGFVATEINIMNYSDSDKILTGPLVSGATKTAILAALCTKQGTTVIHNPYFKPDVTELISFLKSIGYKITFNRKLISITPPDKIKETDYYLVSDITEIITYIGLAVYTDNALMLNNITVDRVKEGLSPELEYLKKMNINLIWGNDHLYIPKNQYVKSVDIEVTSIGIYSDSHPFFTLMLLRGDNGSKITEYVWHNRFLYVDELNKLGLKLEKYGNTVLINPGSPLTTSSYLEANDLRSAAVLIIAALGAPGTSIINNIHHLNRGYENFVGTLKELGFRVEILS